MMASHSPLVLVMELSLNIYLFDKLYNTIQYNTIQYNSIQYITIQYNTIQYNTIQRVYKLGSGKKPVGLIQIRFPSHGAYRCPIWFIAFINSFYSCNYILTKLSRVMRKPTFCVCENKKDADHLRDNLYFLNPKFQASSHLL